MGTMAPILVRREPVAPTPAGPTSRPAGTTGTAAVVVVTTRPAEADPSSGGATEADINDILERMRRRRELEMRR